MNILLINIDSKVPNLALRKIESYHLKQGDIIEWSPMPLLKQWADRIYVSCLFNWNRDKAKQWDSKKTVIGGPGWNPIIKLPPEIKNEKPKLNWGYTSRGCPRQCWFCVVPISEGAIRPIGDIYDLWDGESKKLTLMDNNILALPGHFKKICAQLRTEKIRVDFQQGLDIRLLTEEFINELRTIRHAQLRFAWDDGDIELKHDFEWLFEKLGKCFIYVLCGHLSFKTDLEKLNILRRIGHSAFCMRLEKVRKEKNYTNLARWVNLQWTFHKYTFDEFLAIDADRQQRKKKKSSLCA